MLTEIEQLIPRWREEASQLRERYSDERLARLSEIYAQELEAVLREYGDQALSLEAAAQESGYSIDHLGRLVRQGKLPNAGRSGAPRIRRNDLPKKASSGQEKGAKPEERGIMEGLFRDIVESKYGGN